MHLSIDQLDKFHPGLRTAVYSTFVGLAGGAAPLLSNPIVQGSLAIGLDNGIAMDQYDTPDEPDFFPYTKTVAARDLKNVENYVIDMSQAFPAAGFLDVYWEHVAAVTARVAFRGEDGHIHELWLRPFEGPNWRHGDLTELTGAPEAAGDPAAYLTDFDGTARVVYRGEDERIHELSLPRTGPPWELADLTELTGAPEAAGDPAAYLTDFDDTARVVYRGADEHIHELWLRPSEDSNWRHGDLTELTGAPEAAGDPAAYLTHIDGTARVVYRGEDEHIHELWYPASTRQWGLGDLTELTGAPEAAGDPAAYLTDFDGTARVVYRGEDERIHELSLPRTGPPWELADLTELTGAPEAAGDPAAYLTDFDDTARVVYRGADEHIHELWLRPSEDSNWRHGDLTELTGAPEAAGDPAAYLTDFDDTARVVYRGEDEHIHELWYPASTRQWGLGDLTQLARDSAAVGQIVPHATGHPVAHITDF